jgi:hypothetical protein
MVGDWVVYQGDIEYTDPVQIEGMDIAIDMLITSDREDVGFKGVEPIPLTAEILELNEWQYGDWGNEYENDEYFTNEDIGFDIHINNNKEFEIRCVDAVNITLKFVHELQHALKLCGIDKTIKL